MASGLKNFLIYSVVGFVVVGSSFFALLFADQREIQISNDKLLALYEKLGVSSLDIEDPRVELIFDQGDSVFNAAFVTFRGLGIAIGFTVLYLISLAYRGHQWDAFGFVVLFLVSCWIVGFLNPFQFLGALGICVVASSFIVLFLLRKP